jgi:hypothetical protein
MKFPNAFAPACSDESRVSTSPDRVTGNLRNDKYWLDAKNIHYLLYRAARGGGIDFVPIVSDRTITTGIPHVQSAYC